MILSIYSIFDKVTGNFSNPFYQLNNASAERFFINVCNTNDNISIKGDLELFRLGTFNIETGEIIPNKPEFLRGGYDNE